MAYADGPPVHTTTALLAIARELLRDPDQPTWVHKLARDAGLHTGTTFAIIGRLARDGWITRDDARHPKTGRAVRLIHITPAGRDGLAAILAKGRGDNSMTDQNRPAPDGDDQ